MFTGLIEAIGSVRTLEQRGEAARLVIETTLAAQLALGESLAVNGCCLTVTLLHEGAASFDLLGETLARTNLGLLVPGSPVNLERALRADGRLGGHFVQGHIDTTAEVLSVERKGEDLHLEINIPDADTRYPLYLLEKGSIAVNGVSLTVASLGDDTFGLWIIPHTLQETNLGELKQGSRVNLEFDLLAKYAERQIGVIPSLRNNQTL